MQPRFIRNRELTSTRNRKGRLPISSATGWRWVAAGLLPPPVRLGPQTVAWIVDEIDAVDKARIAGKSDTEIKALVAQLVAARKEGA